MEKFALDMRFLNGDVQRVQVAPSKPIKELLAWAAKEKGLSEFHGIKAFVGDRELRGGSVAEARLSQGSEIQLVVMRLPEKAVAELDKLTKLVAREMRQEEHKRLVRKTMLVLDFLEEANDLEPQLCDEFLKAFENSPSCVVTDWAARWGRAFGRACTDPGALIPRLVPKIKWLPSCILFFLAALDEIDLRHGDALCGHESVLMKAWLCFVCSKPSYERLSLLAEWNDGATLAVRVIGKYVDLQAAASYEQYFEVHRRHSLWKTFDATKTEAEVICECIGMAKQYTQGRGATSPAYPPEARDVHGPSKATIGGSASIAPEACGEAPAVAAANRRGHHMESENDETEQGLDEALCRSEIEALQEEQAQLQLALLRSKADSLDSASVLPPAGIAVVIDQYSQSKEWLRHALLDGPELQEEQCALAKAGFSSNLPSGAKIFVPPEVFHAVLEHLDKAGWELKSSHVIFTSDLLKKIRFVVEAAREAVTVRERGGSCKLKSHVEVRVPLMHDVGCETLAEPDDDVPPYIVNRTFIEVPLMIPNSMRSASSFQLPSV